MKHKKVICLLLATLLLLAYAPVAAAANHPEFLNSSTGDSYSNPGEAVAAIRSKAANATDIYRHEVNGEYVNVVEQHNTRFNAFVQYIASNSITPEMLEGDPIVLEGMFQAGEQAVETMARKSKQEIRDGAQSPDVAVFEVIDIY